MVVDNTAGYFIYLHQNCKRKNLISIKSR